MTTSVLDREMYTEREAASLLRVPPSTLHYWLEGEGGRGQHHEPVLRPERKGRGAAVTWAEFVEAGLLREYRMKQVSLPALRAFVRLLREDFGVPYPLADRRPFVDQGRGRGLVWDAQEGSNLDADHALVAMASGQYVLTPASQSFFDRIDWDRDMPGGYRPHDDPASSVRCLPSVRFGLPSVSGISTQALWEQHSAGLDDDELAAEYGIPESEVVSAISYERALRQSA